MLAGIILGFAIGLLLFVGIASTEHFHGWLNEPEKRLPPPSGSVPWEELTTRAQQAVDSAQAELPEDIRAAALEVPTLFQEWHPTKSRVLGVYYDNRSHDLTVRKGPIVLYLRAIEAYARRQFETFEEQVRGTYLHELGHHVGWNEGQVRERGL
jgi:predicted Zn-dependent protease with MMP-like domain